MKELLELIPRLAGHRILVVGDLCLDEYLIGQASRLSREAPVPVLEFQHSFTVPGEAANPAMNVVSLGGRATMIGVIGDDTAGAALCEQLAALGIDVRGIVVASSRRTTVKTRVLAAGSHRFPQQLVRIDRLDRSELGQEISERLVALLNDTIPVVDAVLLSDYKGGVISERVIEATRRLAQAHQCIATVDSQGDLFSFRGFTVVKANQAEAGVLLRRQLTTEEDFVEGGHFLQKELGAQAILITRGGDGMSLVQDNGQHLHIPAANRSEVFDVTGAGDTVIATLTLALAAGASLLEAVHLANYAAGVAVRRLGNVAPTPSELAKTISGG